MDSSRFDRFARSLIRHPRRDLLKPLVTVVVSGSVASVLAADAEGKKKKKKKKKPNENRCPGGCGFNERCVGNQCVPGCVFNTTPCGVACCLDGAETCQNGQCVSLCPDRRPSCGGLCCEAGLTCQEGVCGQQCPAGRVSCGSVCCAPSETCQGGQCAATCAAAQCPHFVFERVWDGAGASDGKFKGPNAIAVDSDNVYVVDAGNDLVRKFDTDGQQIDSWTAPGYGIAIHGDVVYVANGSFVSTYTTGGAFIAHLTASGMFNAQDVAADADGAIYVITSAAAGRLFVFDSSGEPVRNWGGASGEFLFADGVVVDSVVGEVYVADTFHNRIQRFTGEGVFDDEWGQTGSDQRRLSSPNGLAIDADGNIFVADYGSDLIKVYEYDTGFLAAFGDGGTTGPLNGPASVAIDSNGTVFVADYLNNRVVKYVSTGRPLGGGGRPERWQRRARARKS